MTLRRPLADPDLLVTQPLKGFCWLMARSIILYKYKITIGIIPIHCWQKTFLKYLTVLWRWYCTINWQKDAFSFAHYAPPHHDLYNIWMGCFWNKMWMVLFICFALNINFFLALNLNWCFIRKNMPQPVWNFPPELALAHFLCFKRLGAWMITPFLSALLQYPISFNFLYIVALWKDVGFDFWNSAIIDFVVAVESILMIRVDDLASLSVYCDCLLFIQLFLLLPVSQYFFQNILIQSYRQRMCETISRVIEMFTIWIFQCI